MSFAVIKRALDADGATPTIHSSVTVDTKVSSTKELEDAITSLQQELGARKKPDLELVAKQLKHIEGELGIESKLPFSLEHLELYERYLRRFGSDGLPLDVKATQERLLLTVQARLKGHPLSSEARSGDAAGNEEGFVPLKIPTHRRRQVMVMLYLNLLTGPALTICSLLLFWYLVPFSTYMFLLYALWVTYDNMTRPMPAPKRVVQWWRQNRLYALFRDYFPLRTVLANRHKEEEQNKEGGAFDPSHNYLFCYHPHGVQSAGAFSFASVASGFDVLFPGLTCSVQTLGVNFKFPITRENLISLGCGDASKPCLLAALGNAPGSSAMLVTGGAKESMFAHPGNSQIVMKDRAGFVKVALIAGASLVPTWGFGENNLYENLAVKSSTVRKWQRRLQKTISFAPLLMEGRGVFSYSGGLLPHRRPITVVVGDPIKIDKKEPNPSNERVAEVHKQYQEALTSLFNTYKDIYDPKAEPLEFV